MNDQVCTNREALTSKRPASGQASQHSGQAQSRTSLGWGKTTALMASTVLVGRGQQGVWPEWPPALPGKGPLIPEAL